MRKEDEVKDRRRNTDRSLAYEACQSAVDALFQHALETGENLAFLEFLAFAKRFSNLSVYNAMLVRVQHPGATAVASARRWAGIDRYPKPGARPLMILQPFGPVTFVYAMEDSEGREISGADASSLFAAGMVKHATYERLIAAAANHGVRVAEQAMARTLWGSPSRGTRSAPGGWQDPTNRTGGRWWSTATWTGRAAWPRWPTNSDTCTAAIWGSTRTGVGAPAATYPMRYGSWRLKLSPGWSQQGTTSARGRLGSSREAFQTRAGACAIGA